MVRFLIFNQKIDFLSITVWYGNKKCNGKEMIKRSKGKSMGCNYMLFGITIYKENTYVIIETPTRVAA